MTQNNKKEEVRQKIEKILWKHYNDGGYAMNGEEASNEILNLFSQTLERERIKAHAEGYLEGVEMAEKIVKKAFGREIDKE